MFGLDELGLDLGTSMLHIVVKGKGVVLSDPAYVAYERETREVTAMGEDAWRMYGKTPETMAVERPMRQGHIRSFDLVSKMLHSYLRKLIGRRAAFRPRLILALPSGVVPSERQTLIDICVDAGVRSVMPVDESVLSAIGCGTDVPASRSFPWANRLSGWSRMWPGTVLMMPSSTICAGSTTWSSGSAPPRT